MKSEIGQIKEAYHTALNEAKKITDKQLIQFGIDEFQYSKNDAKEWVDSMDKKERAEHEEEIRGRLQGLDKY